MVIEKPKYYFLEKKLKNQQGARFCQKEKH
jgi:hypothetical protein